MLINIAYKSMTKQAQIIWADNAVIEAKANIDLLEIIPKQ